MRSSRPTTVRLTRSLSWTAKRYTTPQGVAHYLEHKMFDLPEGNAMQEFAKYAGANNAFTSYTMTAYYVECTEHLEENLEILLRMVTTGYFTEESVQKERGIIAQEIRMYDDSADSAVMETCSASCTRTIRCETTSPERSRALKKLQPKP